MIQKVIIDDLAVHRRLAGIKLNIRQSSFTHVLGENGAGKSSLLAVMAGLLPPDSGSVHISGKDISHMQLSELATFRGYHQQLNAVAFELTAAEFIQFYASADHCGGGLPWVLEQVLEIKNLMNRKLTELSGGELQRVNLCRALLQVWSAIEQGQGLLLLDEPLQGLDIRHQYALVALLRDLARQGNTVVITSHDISLSANSADNLVLLKAGSVVATGAPDAVIDEKSLMRTFNCEFTVTNSAESIQIQVRRPIPGRRLW